MTTTQLTPSTEAAHTNKNRKWDAAAETEIVHKFYSECSMCIAEKTSTKKGPTKQYQTR